MKMKIEQKSVTNLADTSPIFLLLDAPDAICYMIYKAWQRMYNLFAGWIVYQGKIEIF